MHIDDRPARVLGVASQEAGFGTVCAGQGPVRYQSAPGTCMTSDGMVVTTIFVAGLLAFASGRGRHDIIAVLMLLAAIMAGAVAPADAFSGLADPVVVTVAGVMVLSAAVSRSGVLPLMIAPFQSRLSHEMGLTLVFCALCAAASSIMNNVGALALLLPAALKACRSASVPPGRILMPMAFASLLGGMITLIGTPPNIIVAGLAEEATGRAFGFFDFTLVGLPLAVIGIAVMALALRFLPTRTAPGTSTDPIQGAFLVEATTTSPVDLRALQSFAPSGDPVTVGVPQVPGRPGTRLPDDGQIQPGFRLQLEGRADTIQALMERFQLRFSGSDSPEPGRRSALLTCMVTPSSSLAWQAAADSKLRAFGGMLRGINRNHRPGMPELSSVRLKPGDRILIACDHDRQDELLSALGLIALSQSDAPTPPGAADLVPLGAMGAAIALAAAGILPLAVSFLFAIAALVCLRRVDGRVYGDIDWSILVLLAAILPVASAFATSGAAAAMAGGLEALAPGAGPLGMVAIILFLTVVITPFVNNAAAVLIMGPVALTLAEGIGLSPEAALMAVAIGASCDFLTPIGHQCNTLVMGPGGYRFLDYPRLGLPVTVAILLAGPPLIWLVWG